eukprot:CAMPEP_0174237828 /NCGR_PEP_ID=MMETSP0417-20130205/9370_1 /TAXON_ID=242541 /ORGANISM="Mayorella sp, Strain BSH-02190019" /LENGTH=278 /DNA_ID=CAMNT_0015316613 /DNA_START=67 /DNA_END=900 /DNA_ORIENTATION=-
MSARSASKLVAKEMKELAKLDFHLDQVQVLLPDENNVRELQLLIKPTDGVYKGGSFLFNMSIPDAYPEEPPVFKPVHTLFHPNIDRSGNVCFNVLKKGDDDWSNTMRIQDYAHAMLWLFYQPNLMSRLNTDCSRDANKFAVDCQKAMRGLPVEGKTYHKCIEDEPEPKLPEPVIPAPPSAAPIQLSPATGFVAPPMPTPPTAAPIFDRTRGAFTAPVPTPAPVVAPAPVEVVPSPAPTPAPAPSGLAQLSALTQSLTERMDQARQLLSTLSLTSNSLR